MWNKNKAVLNLLRKKVEDIHCKRLHENLQPGMLTYMDVGKTVDKNDIAEAVFTISLGTGIPPGKIVMAIDHLKINQAAEKMKDLSKAAEDSAKALRELYSAIDYSENHETCLNENPYQQLENIMDQSREEWYRNALSVELMQGLEEIFQNFDKDMDRRVECIVTKDMTERLKAHISKPPEVHISKEPYTDIRMPYTGVEFFRRQIEEANTYTVSGYYYIQSRHEKQHEAANRNRHTSRHIPFYFPIFGQNRFVPQNNGRKDHTKFNRNVRPKGTHSHFKFYR